MCMIQTPYPHGKKKIIGKWYELDFLDEIESYISKVDNIIYYHEDITQMIIF